MYDGQVESRSLSAQSARRAGAADRRHGRRWKPGTSTTCLRPGAPRRALRRADARDLRGRARHAVGPLSLGRVRRAAAAHHLGPRRQHAAPRARARSESPSSTAAPFPIAASTASSSPAAAQGRARRANSTRRWSSRAARAKPSSSAQPPGASKRSPTTAYWSPPRPASRARCLSGTATARGVRWSSASRSAAMTRELLAMPRPAAYTRLVEEHSLDGNAAENLLRYLEDQRAATGRVPSDEDILIERCRDELGDWRICVLDALRQPRARPLVHGGHLAAARRARHGGGDRCGRTTASSSACRRATRRSMRSDSCPIAAEVQGTGAAPAGHHFPLRGELPRAAGARPAAAAQAPPGLRAPLWQQRKRSADLLAVAAQYPVVSHPAGSATASACATSSTCRPPTDLLTQHQAGADTRDHASIPPHLRRSPRRCCFFYVANYIYDGDAPLAERRAQALAIDQSQLEELLGDNDLRELLDASAHR